MKNPFRLPLLLFTTFLIFSLSACGLFRQKEPVANFTVFNDGCDAPCEVLFNNTSERADSYEWDFGDGLTSSISDPNHTYANGGTYTVTLQATNESGTVSASTPITINGNGANPYSTFTLSGLTMNQYPTQNGGQDWDAGANSPFQNPDIFYQVEDVNGSVFYTSQIKYDVQTTDLPENFVFFSADLTQIDVLHRIKFYDEDSAGDALMGTLEFTPSEHPPTSGNDSEFFLSGDGFTIYVDAYWQN